MCGSGKPEYIPGPPRPFTCPRPWETYRGCVSREFHPPTASPASCAGHSRTETVPYADGTPQELQRGHTKPQPSPGSGSPLRCSRGTAATSAGVRCRHHAPRQVPPRRMASLIRSEVLTLGVPVSASASSLRALSTALRLPPSARAATHPEGHTRPSESHSGRALRPSRASSSWKGGSGGGLSRGAGPSRARSLRLCSFRPRPSPGAYAGAHAARTNAHNRAQSDGWSSTCRTP